MKMSSGVPLVEGAVKTLFRDLGPSTLKDQIIIETSDHAKLYLGISYKWHFDTESENNQNAKMFMIQDFFGDTSKALASRIRGAVSGITFQNFRHSYGEIIENTIFKKDSDGKKIPYRFTSNNLIIEDIAIENVDPVDKKIEESLNKSLNLTFDIETRA